MYYKISLFVLFSFIQLNIFALVQSDIIVSDIKNDVINAENRIFSQSTSENLKNTNNISGNIYAGINLLPEGDIYILNNSKSVYHTVKNEKIINGKYQFENVNSGDYILYVIPKLDYNFLFFPKYIPTYFGKSYSWQKALNNSINKGNQNLNLDLISFQYPFYGEKSISGHLKFGGTSRGIKNLPIPVILLNENGVAMDFRIADNQTGEFTFNYLPEGTYYIHPEIAGLKTDDYKIVINENHSNDYNNIDFFVNNENIKIDRESDEITPVVCNRYLKIFLQDDINYPVVCELIDLSGKSIDKKVFYSDEISINTSGMAANIYILKVKTYDNSPVKTAKVFIRNY